MRSGREVEARAGIRVPPASAPVPDGPGMPGSASGMAGAGVGPADDYLAVRCRQEFRKKADAAAEHDVQAKKKP